MVESERGVHPEPWAQKAEKPGPRFGEDNDNILRDILGKTPAQIAALKASNVLSDTPTNPGISGTMDTASMLALKTLIAVDQDYRTG